MRKLILVAFLSIVSEAAFAQAGGLPDQDVNPHTPSTSGEKSKFGMNNGGNPKTGEGLHGGDTSDAYKAWVKKEGLQNEDGKNGGKK